MTPTRSSDGVEAADILGPRAKWARDVDPVSEQAAVDSELGAEQECVEPFLSGAV